MTFEEAMNQRDNYYEEKLRAGAPYYIMIAVPNGEDDVEWQEFDGFSYRTCDDAIDVASDFLRDHDAAIKVVNCDKQLMWED